MPQAIFAYHLGMDAEQYAFFRIPKLLITEPYFRRLSTDAKLLYGLMLDRMSLSMRNGWMDDDGHVYIYLRWRRRANSSAARRIRRSSYLRSWTAPKAWDSSSVSSKGWEDRQRSMFSASWAWRTNQARIRRNRSLRAAEIQTSEKPKSRVLKNRSLDLGKSEVKTSEKPSVIRLIRIILS